MNKTQWDAIIVGSGVGGLTTAAYLATHGRRVLVLEAQAVVGGAAQQFTRKRVFDFDCGAHYIGDCELDGVIPTVLRGVGLEGVVRFNNMDPDGFDTIIAPDLRFRVPRGWRQFETRLVRTFPQDAKGIRAVLKTLREAAEATEQLNVPPVPSPVALLKHPRTLWPLLKNAMTLEQLFDLHRLGEHTRTVIGYICMFLLLPRTRFPAAIYAWALNHYIKSGGWYAQGGVGKIPKSLARVLRSHGGEIRLHTRVESVLIKRSRAYGVRLTTGEEIYAPVVVSNADIKTTYSELIGHQHADPKQLKRIEKAKLTPSLFSVYLGLDIDLRQHMPATHMFVVSSHDFNPMVSIVLDPTTRDLPENDYAIWITSATVKDTPRAGTEGYSSLEITTGTPQSYAFWGLEGGILDGIDYHQRPAYLARKQEIEARIVAKVKEELPFIDGHIVWQESSTMLSHEDWTLTRYGAWAGLDFSLTNILRRPGPHTEIKGLYLAGASSNGFGAIVGTLRGGVETASAILGRDLWQEVKAGKIFGHGLTDTVFQPAVRAYGASSGKNGFHALRVSKVEPLTADSVAIEFEIPETLRDAFAFQPGQHLTIRGEYAGEAIRRSYSICSAPSSGALRIAVKRLPNGVFSTFAVNSLKPGTTLEVMAPRGHFGIPVAPRQAHSYVAIAAGSGITPLLSIITATLESEAKSHFTLLYGNRSRDSIMFRNDLDALILRYPDRLQVRHYLSRDMELVESPATGGGRRKKHVGATLHAGRMDGGALSELLVAGDLNTNTVAHWFLCGPQALVEVARDTLKTHGVSITKIHFELFHPVERRVSRAVMPNAGKSSTITLTASGEPLTFVLTQDDETILDAAIRLRDDLPYSCLSGSCGSCRARLLTGEVDMEEAEGIALSNQEREQGCVLTCLARPISNEVVLDFDT